MGLLVEDKGRRRPWVLVRTRNLPVAGAEEPVLVGTAPALGARGWYR
jgi:hypothetical protein